jgi:hypothetical protein
VSPPRSETRFSARPARCRSRRRVHAPSAMSSPGQGRRSGQVLHYENQDFWGACAFRYGPARTRKIFTVGERRWHGSSRER